MSLADTLKNDVHKMVDEKLQELGVPEDTLKRAGGPTPESQFALTKTIWRQGGWPNLEERHAYPEGSDREDHRIKYVELCDALDEDAKKMVDNGLKDAVETSSAALLIPKVITQLVREAAQPFMVGESLMRRINFSAGEQITFPASGGGMWAEDIPPGGEYPEQTMEFAGYVTANIGKSGLKVRITDEMLRYSMYDVMSMHVQSASRALQRHKENKIFQLISNEGFVTFDNTTPGNSTQGYTTGRAISGLYNKTITLDDLFVMYADMLNAGFIPNVLLMNPMGWLIFARDGVMRNFGFMNNGALFQAAQGQPGKGPELSTGGVNMGPSVGMETPGDLNPQASTYTPVPSLFPAPLSVIVSPFIDFDETSRTTDIAMADRNELGIIVVDEDPHTEQWDEPRRDIVATKIRERYGLALDNQGEAVRWAKGVRIAKNYDWEDNLSLQWQIGTGTLPTGFVPGI